MTRVPLVWPSHATPPAEIGGIKALYAHLAGLDYSIQAWEAALLLYQTAKQPSSIIPRSVARRWLFLACNECVLELYHLRSRLNKIQSVQLRKCPSLRAFVNMATLRSARKKLDDYFSGIEPMRHAAAHRGENESHPEVHAPDGQYALTSIRDDDVYTVPYQGKLCYLEISTRSLAQVTTVVTEFLYAFVPAASELEKYGHLD